MDPFRGGGSSFEAAQLLKRYWIGCEITDCAPIAARLAERFPTDVGHEPPKKLTMILR